MNNGWDMYLLAKYIVGVLYVVGDFVCDRNT